MSITTVQPSTNSTVATSAAHTLLAAASTNQLSYNDFLTLLMAELKNQDPTQPMDATQTVAQLATVSEVGQSVQANKTLSSLLTATSLAQAPMLVGQSITSADGSTTGTVASIDVTSTGATATLLNGDTVSLTNGATVK